MAPRKEGFVMLTELLFFCGGVFVGVFFSFFTIGLCAMAKRGEEAAR